MTPEATRKKPEFALEVKRGLEEAGIQVELSGLAEGPSGRPQTFDLLVTKAGKKVPVDIRVAKAEQVEFNDILETYAKVLNTKSRPCVVAAVPTASQDAKKAAVAFGLILIEGKDVPQIVAQVSAVVMNLR